MEWQDISSAPMNGTHILAHGKGWHAPQAVYFERNVWNWGNPEGPPFWCFVEPILQDVDPEAEPTHWMPLPDLPSHPDP